MLIDNLVNGLLIFILFLILHLSLIHFTKINNKLSLIISTATSYFYLIYLGKINIENLNVFIFFFSLLLIYIEFFSLINIVFTISIITSVKKNFFKKSYIEKIYSNNKGLRWMLKKRINGLFFIKIICIKNKKYNLTNFGNLIFYIIIFSIKLFNIKKLGQ